MLSPSTPRQPNAPDASRLDPGDMERAARIANLAWAVVANRLPYRSHRDRLRALEAAGEWMHEDHPVFASGIVR